MLDKRVTGDKISSDMQFEKGAEGLTDAMKRIELLEEFMYVSLAVPHWQTVTLLPACPR